MASNIKAEFIGFDYYDEGVIAEIKRNIEMIIATPAGTCPGDRNFGIAQDYVGSPGPVAQNQIALEIIDKVEQYEPRVEVIDIRSEHEDGRIINYVRIGPNDEWVDTEEIDDETAEMDQE